MQQAAQIKDHDLLSKEMADDDYTHQYETITSASRISMLLRPLMEKHAIITATFPDSNQFYNCL